VKKYIILIFLFVAALAPLACKGHGPVSPKSGDDDGSTVTNTPTPTVANTPTTGCGMAPVTLPAPVVPVTISGVVYPFQPPAASSPATIFSSPLFNWPSSGYVIRNLSDWQAFYGTSTTPAPPVNFSTQMIIVLLYQGCFDTV
jgi:hypothetical protein